MAPCNLTRILFAAALGISLSWSAAARADSWVKSAAIVGNYDPADPEYGSGRGRSLPAVFVGKHFMLPPGATHRAIAKGMRGDANPPLSPAEAAEARLRVVWHFDDAGWLGKGSCLRRRAAADGLAVMPGVARSMFRVVATLCRDQQPITEAVGFVPNTLGPDSKQFVAFIEEMTTALFPLPNSVPVPPDRR